MFSTAMTLALDTLVGARPHVRGQHHVWRREQRISRYYGLRFHHICTVAGELTTLERGCHVTFVDQLPTGAVDEIRPGLHQRQACRVD